MKTNSIKNLQASTETKIALALALVVFGLLGGCSKASEGQGFTEAQKQQIMAKPDPNHPPQAMLDMMKKMNQNGPPSGNVKSPWSK